jgi:hypothetical protein
VNGLGGVEGRAVALLATLALVAGGCGGDDGGQGGEPAGEGLAFSVAFEPDPPVAGEPVTWSLTVRNDGGETVILTFPSGKRGDVVLEGERDEEVYRWSEGRFFTEAVTKEQLRPDQEAVYRLEEPSLSVEPGDYDLVATLAAGPEVGPARQRVHIR